ncbi:MAG: chromate transporter [Opitutales bacterium]|nr:chromate transporter [Opitutales bacterium]
MAVAAAAFVAVFFFNISFIAIILSAALMGWIGHRFLPRQFPADRAHGAKGHAGVGPSIDLPPCPPATWRRAGLIAVITLALWWGPVMGLGYGLGWESTPAQQGLFFSKAALVTFGGAYAVLPYVAQQAVENYQWIESIGNFPKLSATLATITACVVGVILNLGVKFSLAALWPGGGSLDAFVLVVAVLAFVVLRTRKNALLPLIAVSALAGVAWSYIA